MNFKCSLLAIIRKPLISIISLLAVHRQNMPLRKLGKGGGVVGTSFSSEKTIMTGISKSFMGLPFFSYLILILDLVEDLQNRFGLMAKMNQVT